MTREVFHIIICHNQEGCCHKRPALKNLSQYLCFIVLDGVIEIVTYLQLHLSTFN